MVEEVLKSNGDKSNNNLTSNGKHIKSGVKEKRKELVVNEKVFMARNSLLNDLMEIPHVRAVKNFMIVIFILLFMNSVIADLVSTGSVDFGLKILIGGFGKINKVALVWICMQSAALLPYVSVKIWSKCRQFPTPGFKIVWDITALLLFITYQCILTVVPCLMTRVYKLPFVSSVIVLTEMIRFVMKSHAFVRSMTPRVINAKKSSNAQIPTFSWYMYYLFAPTLIYRDNYPRTDKIRWKKVATPLLEIVVASFCVSFLCEHIIVRPWERFGLPDEKIAAIDFVYALFASTLPSLLGNLCGFYLLLHCWHNATAELLRFADRQFYTDWWNQGNYSGYYRTWNIIIHDWLHTYIYKDMIYLTKNKLISTLLVFLVSAIFHEVILTFSFGFFYPVMLIFFGVIGVIVIFLTKYFNPTVGNIFIWWSITIGDGFLWTLYGIEYYARYNCPSGEEEKLVDFASPRTFACQQIYLPEGWKLQYPLSSFFQ